MKKRLLFVVNPISGIGKQKRIEKVLADYLDHDQFDYEVRYTEHIHHGTDIARECVEKGYDCVVAVGGDGSVNDVVTGLKDTGTTLGIIPCGSGNGLARCMGIPLTPSLAVKVLNKYYETSIDTITVNNSHIVASIAGVGFDAYIARLMQKAKTRGFSAYLNLILREYASYKCKDYTLIIDGKEIQRNAWFITLANSNQFGYNAAVAPQAKLNDGLIDISIVDKIPIEHIPVTGPLVYANHFELSQHAEMFKAHEVIIHGNIDKWVNIDGEGENVGKDLVFTNHHDSLKVIGKEPRKKINPIADIHADIQKIVGSLKK